MAADNITGATVTPTKDLASSAKHVPSSSKAESSNHRSHPSLPSPTLTNPDMILPSAPRIAGSPTLSYHPETPPSPTEYLRSLGQRDVAQMMALNEIQEAALNESKGNGLSIVELDPEEHSAASSRTMSPSDHTGHRLSVVDESAEITPRNSQAFEGLASSPTLRDDNARAAQARPGMQRKFSDTSSVHTEDLESLMWSRYEASKGRGKDSMGQQMESLGSPKKSPGIDDDDDATETWSDDEVDQGGADIVSSALSKRAEMILASAKERLLLMEGNLRGARHSLLVSPSLSLRALKSSSELSNQVAVAKARDRQLYRGLGVNSKHPLHQSPGAYGSPGHSRVFSETLIQQSSSPSASLSRAPSQRGMRSSSALGSLGSGDDTSRDHINVASNGMVVRTSRSHEYIRAIASNTSDSASLRKVPPEMRAGYGLDPLPEHEPSPMAPKAESLSRTSSRLHRSSTPLKEQMRSESPKDTPITQSPRGYVDPRQLSASPTPSPRTTADLKEQMAALKGRISNLREKAKEDTLRRRSLQSMRTPSPFTAAETWYYGADGYKQHGISQDAGVGEKSTPVEELPPGLAAGLGQPNAPILRNKDSTTTFQMSEAWDMESRYEDAVQQPNPVQETPDEGNERVSRHDFEFEDTSNAVQNQTEKEAANGAEEEYDDGDDEDYPSSPKSSSSSSTGSLEAESIYEEASQELPGVRHEDRPDAFDYQHFFLHSSMGTYGNYRNTDDSDESGSVSDADSVETATPANAADDGYYAQPTKNGQRQLGPSPAIIENWQRPSTAHSMSSTGTRSTKSTPPYIKGHGRTISTDTVSSVATFATATEGRRTAMSRSDYDTDTEDDSTLNQAVGLNGRFSIAPPVPKQPSTTTAVISVDTEPEVDGMNFDPVEPHNGWKGHAANDSGSSNSVTPTVSPTDANPAHVLLNLASGGREVSPLEGLSDKDRTIVLNLAETLVKACDELRGEKGQRYDARVWRRRMDGARRLLKIGVDGRDRSASRTRGTTPDIIRENEAE